MYGTWPDEPKLVLVAAPHTSNWDGINMLAAAGYFRASIQWMGKKELTTGPFGGIVKWLGCVPIDRASANDVVAQMTQAFSERSTLILAVPPEGTRSKTKKWKTGFYHIAHAAKVPIMMTVLDYGTKSIRVSGVLKTSGDYDHDMMYVKPHYEGAKGKFDEKFTS